MKTESSFGKQVDKSHYEFSHYMSKERWACLWHQLNELQRLHPKTVLEVGPGPGLFKTVASAFGIRIETLDPDPCLQPDHVGSATEMPFANASYEVVCAFQVLEHLPYEAALKAFQEIARVSIRHVIISLPDARPMWRYQFHIPRLGLLRLSVPRPQIISPPHVFDGQHHWEINKRGYPLSRLVTDLTRHIRLASTYRVFEYPYHRFFVFDK